MSFTTKLGHGAAKVLGINLHYRNEYGEERVQRGESVFSVGSADTYVEQEPTSLEWLREHVVPSKKGIQDYFFSLFPFLHWILHYNWQWFVGDMVAGLTVGAVVVPQSMAYAGLANLPPQFGLYSAFMGVMIYWFFATSKDITIGPVAVMSTIIGNVVIAVKASRPDLDPIDVALSMAIIAGAIVFFLGAIRMGWLVEFISLTAVCAFITGSSFSIAMGQIPGLLGIGKAYVNNRAPTYEVVIGVLSNLNKCKLDAAIGLTSLFLLYLIRAICQYGQKRMPSQAKAFFFMSTLRTIFVILLYTLISWLVNKDIPKIHSKDTNKLARFGILGEVPRGFTHAGAPKINLDIIRAFADQIPSSVIVLLIEHISIAKSFGRINNYTINPSQELLAIGVTNLLGPFVGAYPATGSFSRTAIKSKAGVRTPLAGVITGIVVLIAIYALTAVFFYIPNAALSAVIIHAVLDLITPANTVYQFWLISPLEVFIFIAGVLITVFSSIENGIYTTIAVSAALLLWRVAKAQGRFLGRVTVHSVVGDHVIDQHGNDRPRGAVDNTRPEVRSGGDLTVRNVFLPIDHRDGSNPTIQVERPYPGVFVYRFSEGFNYPNVSHYMDHLCQTIFKETRRTDPFSWAKKGDRPWNDPGPRKGQEAGSDVDMSRPTLKAIILDFSSVNNVDITTVQQMIDVRNQLDRYAKPEPVEWHFAHINNRWTKRALASAGFGYPTPQDVKGEFHRWKPLFSVAEMGGSDSAAAAAEAEENRRKATRANDVESADVYKEDEADVTRELNRHYSKAQRFQVVQGLNRPFFHIDLTSALQSAVSSIERKETIATQAPRDGKFAGDINEAARSEESS